ncbi:putative A disintegrin and metalloproteinase with thrombospondin motifs 9, partial [Apostichopus japonicus]
CSVLCGLGVKNRSVTCLDEYHDVMPDSECPEPKPKAVRKCARAPCAKWVAGSWSQCSVTCGKGQMFRPVLCVGDGQIMEDGVCRVRRSNKPPSVKRCTVGECPRFKWYKDEWGECSQTCGGGERFRDILCQDRDNNEFIEESYCSNRRKPHASMGCNKDPCHLQRARWNSGQWSECSKHVTLGYKSGRLYVRLSARKCSATCGLGTQIRQVECQDRYGSRTSEDSCRVPAIKQYNRDCTLRPQSSCKDLQHLGNISEDGEYRLLIKGQFINIFCHQMSSTNPQEFLTLPQDIENFSEIYSKRLLAPLQCPYKGRRNDSCACTNAGHQEAGLTTFSKVRLNITTLEIITTDSTFARVRNGVFVPFATAGDCYSAEDCPQGNFRINLRDTGFTISSEAEWTTQGYAVSKTIDTSESNQLIRGHCGGYCGVCLPSRLKGRVLPLDVL